MRLFVRLFVGLFLFQLALWGMAAAFHGDYPALSFLIIPAIWIAMVVGGVHSAGPLSLLVGIAVTTLFYALLASLGVLAAKFLLGNKMPRPGSSATERPNNWR